MRSLLAYWLPTTADKEAGKLLDHSASQQFRTVKADDTIYVVTVRQRRLYFLGRLIVGSVTNQDGAEKLLDRASLWHSDHHVVAKKGTAKRLREIDITDIAPALRFISTRSDRLDLNDGVNGGQFQTKRVLTPASAAMLDDL